MKQNLTQYATTENLKARITLHRESSTNPVGFYHWVFDKLELNRKRILDVGCGTCALWRENIDRIPAHCHITLADSSDAMVAEAKAQFGNDTRFTITQADMQSLPFEDEQFDVVISNHMLFHVSDIPGALWEARRVLKAKGVSYATASDQHVLQTLYGIIKDFDDRIDIRLKTPHKRFNRHNGLGIMEDVFDEVEMLIYENHLEITEADLLVDYVLSLVGVSNITEIIEGERVSEFKQYLEGIIAKERASHIPNRSVMFISRLI